MITTLNRVKFLRFVHMNLQTLVPERIFDKTCGGSIGTYAHTIIMKYMSAIQTSNEEKS